MKWLDKYLYLYPILMIIGMLLLVVDISKSHYWISELVFGLAILLFIFNKRRSIKEFFATNKVHVLDKWITSLAVLMPAMLIFFNRFMKKEVRDYYFYYLFFAVLIILAVLSKRNFLKKCFIQTKNEKKTNNAEGKIKTLDRIMQYIFIIECVLIMVGAGLLILRPENIRINLNFIPVTLIIMLVALAIYEHKKKSIKQE